MRLNHSDRPTRSPVSLNYSCQALRDRVRVKRRPVPHDRFPGVQLLACTGWIVDEILRSRKVSSRMSAWKIDDLVTARIPRRSREKVPRPDSR